MLAAAALASAFWVMATPVVNAAATSASQTLAASLPGNKTLANASKAELAAALTAAIRNSPQRIGELVRAAVEARKGDVVDLVDAAIRALGSNPDCELVVKAVEAGMQANPEKASKVVQSAMRIASSCQGAIDTVSRSGSRGDGGTDSQGSGNFSNAAGNVNPAPGSIGGGSASQAGRCQVCHNEGNGRRRTLTISCNAVPGHIGHGDTEGPCPVTPTQNP